MSDHLENWKMVDRVARSIAGQAPEKRQETMRKLQQANAVLAKIVTRRLKELVPGSSGEGDTGNSPDHQR